MCVCVCVCVCVRVCVCMYVCTYTHLYIHIYLSQHVDLSNINALCLGGGTRCSGGVSVPCFTSDTCHKL